MENYFIKDGYKCNLNPQGETVPYLDNKINSRSYQVEVYKIARDLIQDYKLKSVLDVGCGVGEKLEKFIFPICKDITGVDTKHAIDYCKSKYSFSRWHIEDIENPSLDIEKKYDLIISSDVIEHLVNPDKLLSYIKKYAHKDTLIVISTPERDLVRGKKDLGPPKNISHVREWNIFELSNYLESFGFKILNKFLVAAVSGFNLSRIIKFFKPSKTCQVFACKIKGEN